MHSMIRLLMIIRKIIMTFHDNRNHHRFNDFFQDQHSLLMMMMIAININIMIIILNTQSETIIKRVIIYNVNRSMPQSER